MKEQLSIWQEQMQGWRDRIDFLTDWKGFLTTQLGTLTQEDAHYYVVSDKIYELGIEIESKLNVINKRERDMGSAQVMLTKQMEQLEKEWPKVIKKLRRLDTKGLTVEYRTLVDGILKRSKKEGSYRNGQQQFQDMELAQNILASVENQLVKA